MEFSFFENGIQAHNLRIQQTLLKEGLYVMHESGYSYTVGMRNIQSPDLILFGGAKDTAEELFQVLFLAVQHGFTNLQDSCVIDVFEPQPKVGAISNSQKRKYFYAARTYYGHWDFTALKITMEFH